MSFKRVWTFVSNTFEVNTKKSHRMAMTLFADFHAKLKNEQDDAQIAAMFAEFDNVYQVYSQLYAQWNTSESTYHGKTAGFEQIIQEELPIELRKWEGKVRAVFYEDSPTEIEIFPNKRAPFQSGTYEERISAIRGLSAKLSEYPELMNVQLDIEAFYNQINLVRITQQEKEGNVSKFSDKIENQRLVVCDIMYGILGQLMHKYRSSRHEITRFFDLSLLRQSTTGNDAEEETEEDIFIDEE